MCETVDELLEELRERSENGYGECKLRTAIQPTWPLRERVEAVTVGEDDGERIVWLATNPMSSWIDESPYAPRWAWAGGVKDEDFYPEDY